MIVKNYKRVYASDYNVMILFSKKRIEATGYQS